MKTDVQVKREVQEELDWDPAINATEVGVEVRDRVVTLSGHLSTYAEKLAAEKAVQRVAGVKAVVVELDVRLKSSDKRTDEDIAHTVRSILLWTVGVPEDKVKVQVEKGFVTLFGEVEWGYQSRLAERQASQARGVVRVMNQIKVLATVGAVDIGKEIDRALARHVEREAKRIRVTVEGGTVTLSGTVDSLIERSVVRGAAWSAPGVHAVSDQLTVE
jgi:osmotically-inducible protein OsmY